MPTHQRYYTAKGLQELLDQKEKNRIYHVTDVLDTHSVFINFDDWAIILGPYITISWRETEAKELLTGCGLGADMLIPYKIYRCRLPVVGQEDVEFIASTILNSMADQPDLNPIHIGLDHPNTADSLLRAPEIYANLSEVNKRYAWEFNLMDAIQQGNAEQAVRMVSGILVGSDQISFLTNSLSDRISNAFALRVLVRHAALKAGLTPFYVDALSQEYAQKMHRATDVYQLEELMFKYVTAFCQAVRDSQKFKYSPYIKHALQYIELRLNQPITAEELCGLDHLSQQHFARLFKKETGKTVKQYVTQTRCERAAELLKSSRLSIQNISQYVGYEDANYFARVFKSLMGVTPQDYRKSRQEP